MKKYLYGASVQGIQGFIFETNKLREIAGASELIEQICTTEFRRHLEEKKIKFDETSKLIMAAGNIKYQFNNYDDCQKVVKDFAKRIMKLAPGITISQSVVKFETVEPRKKDIDLLEARLKTQRNRAIRPDGLGWMISEHSRNTGNSGVERGNKNAVIDKAQLVKQKASKESRDVLMKKLVGDYKRDDRYYPYDMEHLVDNQKNEWIAVVHADGNSLGKLIQEMIPKLEEKGDAKKGFAEFSKQLDAATAQAANDAFEKIVKTDHEEQVLLDKDNKRRLPIRPVVIGGDDLTVIIRGDLAVDFTSAFLNAFQERTAEYFAHLVTSYNLKDFTNGLTACAGIAYIKPSYPFHYAVELAEELCSYSKKIAKNINDTDVPSCLTFHKVQSSFVEDYKVIIERELKAGDVYFNYGPYATNDSCKELPRISELKEQVKQILRKDSPKSNLRNWLSELSVSKERANQLMARTITITNNHFIKSLDLENVIINDKTHIHNVLSLASIEKR